MPAAITVRQGDAEDNPIAAQSAVHVQVTGAPAWVAAATQDDPFLTAQKVYHLSVREGTEEKGRSQQFTPSKDGDFEWDGYVFPDAGSFTIKLVDEADDSEDATVSVTVE